MLNHFNKFNCFFIIIFVNFLLSKYIDSLSVILPTIPPFNPKIRDKLIILLFYKKKESSSENCSEILFFVEQEENPL